MFFSVSVSFKSIRIPFFWGDFRGFPSSFFALFFSSFLSSQPPKYSQNHIKQVALNYLSDNATVRCPTISRNHSTFSWFLHFMPTLFYHSACVYHQYLKINGDCEQDERRRSFSVESPFSLSHLNASLKRQRRNFFLTIWWSFLLHCASYPSKPQLNWSRRVSKMGTKMKGLYKGFKYTLSQIFVVKEHEMEIGCPTDVKHVAHIGWDGASGSAPSWMNEFKTGSDFAATSIGNSGSALSPWSSRDFSESMRQQSESEMIKDIPSTELRSVKKKEKRKKSKSTSSPKSNSSCSSRPSRAGKSKSKFIEDNTKPTNIEVA